ncbi:MAG: thioredoxin family protein [Rhodospirillaceae bacterium]|nr:thioredoxin family protein [Rhodospirillaceae bacterium]
MAAMQTPICDFGWKAPEFNLPGVDGKSYSLTDISGPKGTLIMFICNHCPYVLAIQDRLIRDAEDLIKIGIGVAAINSNDAVQYPEDSFERMKVVAKEKSYPFPYLFDETQNVARTYGAVCTPDFFGFDATFGLQYRGRLDESRKNTAPQGARRELLEAMETVAKTGQGPIEQIPSMGCSIKWRDAN